MSTLTERDAVLALSLAKLLGVELDPWQERLLQMMFAEERGKVRVDVYRELAELAGQEWRVAPEVAE